MIHKIFLIPVSERVAQVVYGWSGYYNTQNIINKLLSVNHEDVKKNIIKYYNFTPKMNGMRLISVDWVCYKTLMIFSKFYNMSIDESVELLFETRYSPKQQFLRNAYYEQVEKAVRNKT